MGRLCGALAFPFVLAATVAEAQISRSALAAPVEAALNIGVGRFAIPEPAGRRSNMESERRPTDMRRRDRAVAAIAFSFRF
jgi:hypothetical protein